MRVKFTAISNLSTNKAFDAKAYDNRTKQNRQRIELTRSIAQLVKIAESKRIR